MISSSSSSSSSPLSSTTSTIKSSTSSSQRQKQKRQQIRKQNQLHQNQNKYTYFIYGNNGEPQSNWIYNAQFLHVGKAGGGTIRERIEKLNFNIEYKHSPIGRNNTQTTTRNVSTSTASTASTMTTMPAENEIRTLTATPTTITYLIGVRDPIDRYISNFYWQGLTLCLDSDTDNSDNSTDANTMSYNDTRKNSEPLHAVTRKPHKFCRSQTKNIPTSTDISNMIHIKYNSNANELAESLCSTESSSSDDDAIQDMNMLSHAKHTLWDWLQVTGILLLHNQNNDTTSSSSTSSSSSPTKINKNVNVAGMVVEHGYDFLQQIDDSIEYAFTNSFNLQQQQHSDNTNNDQQQRRSQRPLVGDHHHTNTANTAAHDIMAMKLLDLNNQDGDSINLKSGKQNQRKKVKEHSSSSSNKQQSIHQLDYSDLPWIQKMKNHQRNGLSKKGSCCLAKHFYWNDYNILLKPTSSSNNTSGNSSNDVIPSTFLGDLVCNYGTSTSTSDTKSQICIDALNSISQRYRNLQCSNDNDEDKNEEQEQEQQQYTDSDNDNDNDNEENNDADVDVAIKINNKDKEHQRRHEVVNNNKNDLTTATLAIVSASSSSTKAISSSTSAETMMMKTTLHIYSLFLIIFILWLYMVKQYIHNNSSNNHRNKPQQKRQTPGEAAIK